MTSQTTQNSQSKSVETEAFVSGIVLAAGSSSRMRDFGPKQLLRFNQKTLLDRVLSQALKARLNELILVLGHKADSILETLNEYAPETLRVTIAGDYAQGQSRSLRAGLEAVHESAEAAAILLGDQPDLSASTIDQMTTAWRKKRPRLLRPEYCDKEGQKIPGHPVVICRTVWPLMGRLKGDEGAREIIQRHPSWLTTVLLDGPAPRDVDTHSDWKTWVASH